MSSLVNNRAAKLVTHVTTLLSVRSGETSSSTSPSTSESTSTPSGSYGSSNDSTSVLSGRAVGAIQRIRRMSQCDGRGFANERIANSRNVAETSTTVTLLGIVTGSSRALGGQVARLLTVVAQLG
jgi:hypothetical protein